GASSGSSARATASGCRSCSARGKTAKSGGCSRDWGTKSCTSSGSRWARCAWGISNRASHGVCRGWRSRNCGLPQPAANIPPANRKRPPIRTPQRTRQRMPSLFHGNVNVIANYLVARDTYLLRLQAPELARTIRPGQFLMIRLGASSDPLLGRPFALYDTAIDDHGETSGVDVVYLVVGKLTALLAQLRPGDRVDVWGPLGNGFAELAGTEHVALVAGGIGQTPFLAYVHELLGTRGYGGRPPRRAVKRVSLYYGVRSADLAACVTDFKA